jgi:hypothetical protein
MSDLIRAIAERLRAAEMPFAVFGAGARSARGLPRRLWKEIRQGR